VIALAGCANLIKTGRVTQYASPNVDPARFRVLTVIADSENRFDLQVMGRIRERITSAGVNVIRRQGRWDNERQMIQDICTNRPDAFDNVDGIVVARWDRITLHDCGSGNIALEVSGGYSGTDALTDRLLQYLGKQPKS
jgi:hypothetical protein